MEIGEIVELISDITEQTNVLALNAAIQAASAGEAGRGFTVVAEEVQRLAERSGEATKQIEAIVKTIQADTQDAVAAMEKSTVGVVEGTKLSDAAGQALTEIQKVSRELAELIARISAQTQMQSTSVTDVTRGMQGILKITEETTEGTKQTNVSIGQLTQARGGAALVGRRIQGVMRRGARVGRRDRASLHARPLRGARFAAEARDPTSRHLDASRSTDPCVGRRRTEPASDFDLGPLSWVQARDRPGALARAGGARRVLARKPNDVTSLKHARTHVHQAAGAIQMVGLDAVVAFTDEIERQLARLEELAAAGGRRKRATSSTARAASSRSSSTSSSTARCRSRSSSIPNTRRCSARAACKAAAPTDLFYPDLSAARAAHPAARSDSAEPAAVVPRQAAAALPARPARLAARRRGGREDDARRDRRHRGRRRTQAQPARVLVDRRRAARSA